MPTAREAGYPDLTFEGGLRHLWLARYARWRSRSAWSPTWGAIVADPDFRARVLKVGTVPRQRHAGAICRSDRRPARADRRDPCGDGEGEAMKRCISAARCLALARMREEMSCE